MKVFFSFFLFLIPVISHASTATSYSVGGGAYSVIGGSLDLETDTDKSANSIGPENISYLVRGTVNYQNFRLGIESGKYSFKAHFRDDQSVYNYERFTTSQNLGFLFGYDFRNISLSLILARLNSTNEDFNPTYFHDSSLKLIVDVGYNVRDYFSINLRTFAIDGSDNGEPAPYTLESRLFLVGVNFRY